MSFSVTPSRASATAAPIASSVMVAARPSRSCSIGVLRSRASLSASGAASSSTAGSARLTVSWTEAFNSSNPTLADARSSVVNASARASGSEAAATMSRSLQVSVWRRALPAISTRSAAGCSRNADARASAMASARESSSLGFVRSSRPASRATRTDSSAFWPKPGTSRSRSFSAASRSLSSESMPSSSKSFRARFGPNPGSRVISTSPGGYFALSFCAAGISPVSNRTASFSAIVLPMPDSSVTRPALAISSTDAVESRIDLAALRYAITRCTIAPSSS